ncbi:hypothetical protein ACVNHC_12025 [Pannonibacter sp. Q-1]|uniref:hypothetical protein n=1 Tax=Pannonibacter indicus TaxID=466044 RepID=UPI0035B277F2
MVARLAFWKVFWRQDAAETLSFAALRVAGLNKKQTRVCGAAATVRRDVMRYDLWRRNCRRSATIGLQPFVAWKGRMIFSKLPPPPWGNEWQA